MAVASAKVGCSAYCREMGVITICQEVRSGTYEAESEKKRLVALQKFGGASEGGSRAIRL